MSLSLALDFIVIALLVATIAYAIILNRKLAALNNSKEELRGFLETFATSLGQAKQGVEHLKKVSYNSSKVLQDQIKQGKALKDELGFFIENGEKVITRLESTIKHARTVSDSPPSAQRISPSNSQEAIPPTTTKAGGTRTPSAARAQGHQGIVAPISAPGGAMAASPAVNNRGEGPQVQTPAAGQPLPRVEPRLVQALRGLR